ncbi:MAG: class I SAM-dependent methyltransferase [Actinomycetota bacterium]
MESTRAHEAAVADAFDRHAAAFERAPIQNDPRLLTGLVDAMSLPPGSLVLDAGCGPGLVAHAILTHPGGHRVIGVDLSGEMIRRARTRCAPFGDRVELVHGPLADVAAAVHRGDRPPVDAAVTRLVLHHVPDTRAFVAAIAASVRPGGTVVLADHITDPDPALADWHRRVETIRDRSHVANPTPGELLDLAAGAGLADLRYRQVTVATDFDEWFARGTHAGTREDCLEVLLSPHGRGSRAWRATPSEDGRIRITGEIGIVRGVVPA